jgi:hypothetical protein
MISTRSVELVIDTVVCLTLAKWETVSGHFGGYLMDHVVKLTVFTLRYQTYLRVLLSLIPLSYGAISFSAWPVHRPPIKVDNLFCLRTSGPC